MYVKGMKWARRTEHHHRKKKQMKWKRGASVFTENRIPFHVKKNKKDKKTHIYMEK